MKEPSTQTKCALYGFLFVCAAVVTYLLGVLVAVPRRLFFDVPYLQRINEAIVWYSGMPLVVGFLLIGIDLVRHVRGTRAGKSVMHDPVDTRGLTVVLTAYNDEEGIGRVVRDFVAHKRVLTVIVVSNNSTDRTEEEARKAGAVVYNEKRQGYGACVCRALVEALKVPNSEVTVLCEGDSTFSAADLDKLVVYLPHADIVNGTRIVEQLQESGTQLSMIMHYGNLFVGKLLEMKYLGLVTLTDVGTTYKMCRNSVLRALVKELDPRINLEFNAYFLDKALCGNVKVVECPVTFMPRVGRSKGGNVNNLRALAVGTKMIWGIASNWRWQERVEQ